MNSTRREALARLIGGAMKDKGLSGRDIKRESRGKISDSYVNKIATAKAENVSVDIITALGQVLEIDGHEIFEAAYGPRRRAKDEADRLDRSQVLFIFELMRKVVASPGLLALMEELVHLPAGDQAVLLKSAKKLNAMHATSSRRKSPL